MKISRKKVALTLLIFCYLYIPPLFPHSFIVWWVFFVLVCIAHRNTVKRLMTNGCVAIVTIATGICVWSVLRTSQFVGFFNSIRFLSSEIALLIFAPVGILSIEALIERGRFDVKTVWKTIIYAGLIQALIAVAAYIYAPIQTICCFFLKNVMSVEDIIWWRNYRLYGLSPSLSFGMPIAQAIIGGLCILYAKKYDLRFMFLVPVIWISGFINARVSIVVVAIEIILLGFARTSVRYGKIGKMMAMTLMVSLVASFVFFLLLLEGIIKMPQRIMDPIIEFASMINGEFIPRTEGYFQYFVYNSNSLYIPEGVQFLVGGGINNNRSDVGYIIHLWLGGLIFSIVVYLFYIGILFFWWRLIKKKKIERVMVQFAGVTLFITNIKGEACLFIGECTTLFFLIFGITYYFTYICYRRAEGKT